MLSTRTGLHFSFWLAYFVFYFNYMIFISEMTLQLTLSSLIPFGFVVILASYFSMYVLIEKFLYKKKYLLFIIFLTLSSLGFVLLLQTIFEYVVLEYFLPERTNRDFYDLDYCYYQFIQIYIVVGIASSIKIVRKWQKEQLLKAELEKQNLNSEIALLRSQINPHFLFNTINNIDSLIPINPDKASSSLIKLSDIMRYMLYESNVGRVSLTKEIEYIQSLIDLQQLRVRDKNFIEFHVQCENENLFIAPMLFVPFVENAFKHGDKNSPLPGIKIELKTIGKSICFEIENYFKPDTNASKDKVGGIGLGIAKRRLELIYPGKYTLEINKKLPLFTVKLTINP